MAFLGAVPVPEGKVHGSLAVLSDPVVVTPPPPAPFAPVIIVIQPTLTLAAPLSAAVSEGTKAVVAAPLAVTKFQSSK